MTRKTFAWCVGLLAILSAIATAGLYYAAAQLEGEAAELRTAIPPRAFHTLSMAHEAQTRRAHDLDAQADTLRQISKATTVATLILGTSFVFLRVVPSSKSRADHTSKKGTGTEP